MLRKTLLMIGCGLALALSPHGVGAAELDPSCGCAGQVSEPVAVAVGGLAGEALAARIAALVAANNGLTQDIICAARDVDGADIEAIAAGLARSGLTAEQMEAWVCCADQDLLGAFASVTNDICGGLAGGGVIDASDNGDLAQQCSRIPQCVRAGFAQFLTQGFSANSGGGAVTPSRP